MFICRILFVFFSLILHPTFGDPTFGESLNDPTFGESLNVFKDALPDITSEKLKATLRAKLELPNKSNLPILPLEKCRSSLERSFNAAAEISDAGNWMFTDPLRDPNIRCEGFDADYVPEKEGWLVIDPGFFPKFFGHKQFKTVLNPHYISALTSREDGKSSIHVQDHEDGIVLSRDSALFFILRLDLKVHVAFKVRHIRSKVDEKLTCLPADCAAIRATVNYFLSEDYAPHFHANLASLIFGYEEFPEISFDKGFVKEHISDVQAMNSEKRKDLIKGPILISHNGCSPSFPLTLV